MTVTATGQPTPAGAATTTAAGPIPFRKTSPASAPEVFGVLATTLLLLAALYGIGLYARRRGWLARFTGATPTDAPRQLRVLERLQLSRRTTIYRIGAGDVQFLLAESTGAVEVTPVTPVAPVDPGIRGAVATVLPLHEAQA